MQASIENFLVGVLDNRRNYYIPVYQRNYSWKEEQCSVLLEDIYKLYTGEYNEHFIGSIVWKPSEIDTTSLAIIDGQQRLTTMFLLVKALIENVEDERFKNRLNDILIDSYKNKNRLLPIKDDNEVYEKLLNNDFEEIKNKSSRIYLNYVYFYNRLKTLDLDYEKFFEAFNKLQVIKMELSYDDNPQIIFESINSTGISLSIADLIRNYLLMNEDSKTQEYLFNNYWNKFEKKLGLDDLILYFEHYLNINLSNTNVTRNEMYKLFKKYYIKNEFETEDLFKIFEKQINVYEYLVSDKVYELSNKNLTKDLNKYKEDLQTIGNKVVNMFLLQLIIAFEDNKITEEDLVYGFEMTLSYVFRRNLIGMPTSALQKLFRYLYKQVVENFDKYTFKDSFDYALITSKINTGQNFPTDEEFFEALSQRNLYGKFKNLNYLLMNLENYNNKTIIQSDNLTIEHIMPQTMNTYWKNIIGSDYKQIHEENVNDLGNLTLTSYNSNMSNFNFEKKKEILINESHLKLNEYLKDKEFWTIDEIKSRGRYLGKIGLDIWRYPNVNKDIKDNIENDKYSTTDLEELLSNYQSVKLLQLKIEDSIKSIKSYRDILDEVISYVCEIDRKKFENTFIDSTNYVRTSNGKDGFIFSKHKEKILEIGIKQNIASGIFFDVNRSGYQLLKLSRDILEEYNIEIESVEIKYSK